jgi:DNA polymerase-3 subunit epsilon
VIVIDIKTRGTDPKKKHSIVCIGAVDFSNPENQFYQECRIWEGAEIDKEALNINGFSKENLKNPNKKSLEVAIKEFLEWIKNIEEKTIAGENPSFDRDFLKISAQKHEIEWTLGHRTIDLHSLCYTHLIKRGLKPPTENGRSALNLDKILEYVGLPPEPKPHNALTGAKMEAEALSRLIYKKPLLNEFKKYKIPDYLLP